MGGSTGKRNIGGVAEQRDDLTGRSYNEELCVKDREKDLEEETTDNGKSGHGLVERSLTQL